MRHVLLSVAIALALLLWPVAAMANCTTQVVNLPNGKVMYCLVCCPPGGNCYISHCW